jgi:formate hydrogenlyase subunit 3/multisubunit Na+/H+ antiporter MnhD subunit
MLYLLIIFFPAAMAAGLFLLRAQIMPSISGGMLAVIVQIALVMQLPVDAPVRLLGLTLTIDPLGRLVMLTILGVALFSYVVTFFIAHGENFVPVSLLILGITNATVLLMQEPFVASLLMVSSGLLAILAIVDLPIGSTVLVERSPLITALHYLVLVLLSGFAMYMAYVLLTIYWPTEQNGQGSPVHLIMALLIVGFGMRLAIFPFQSWLIEVTEYAAPMVTVLIITALNSTGLLFLIATFQFFPVIVSENAHGMQMLMYLGAVTMILGALFGLATPHLRRTPSYLIVANSGLMLFGVASASSTGLAGAIFELFNQMIAVLIIFVAIALLERPDGRPVVTIRRDLLWRWPLAGSGFIGGLLLLLGMPPFSSYTSKLLIYNAAAHASPAFVVLLGIGSLLTLAAIARLLYERLLGAAEELPTEEMPILLATQEIERQSDRRLLSEPVGLSVVLFVLLGVCCVIGLYPQILLTMIDDVIRGLTFVRTAS